MTGGAPRRRRPPRCADKSIATQELEQVALRMLEDSPARASLGRRIMAKLCENGAGPDTWANFAICLFSGDGGAPDYAGARAQCLRILQSSSASDYTRGVAYSLLANQARYGKGVLVDIPAALKLLERGVACGNGHCAFKLATYWD